jgi:hypothetical protein
MPHPDAAFQEDRPLTVVSLLMDLNGDPWASLTLQPGIATRCVADGEVLDFQHALRALVADGWGEALNDVPVVEGWAVDVHAGRLSAVTRGADDYWVAPGSTLLPDHWRWAANSRGEVLVVVVPPGSLHGQGEHYDVLGKLEARASSMRPGSLCAALSLSGRQTCPGWRPKYVAVRGVAEGSESHRPSLWVHHPNGRGALQCPQPAEGSEIGGQTLGRETKRLSNSAEGKQVHPVACGLVSQGVNCTHESFSAQYAVREFARCGLLAFVFELRPGPKGNERILGLVEGCCSTQGLRRQGIGEDRLKVQTMQKGGLFGQLDDGPPCLDLSPTSCSHGRRRQQSRGLGKVPAEGLRNRKSRLSSYGTAGSSPKFGQPSQEVRGVKFSIQSDAGNDELHWQRVVRQGGNDEGIRQRTAKGLLVAPSQDVAPDIHHADR